MMRARSARLRRLGRRSSERGAAVFVVVLVITMLSALGMFALRSATFANATTGYGRQMSQTHYMTEFALVMMASELGGMARQNYADEMWSGTHAAQCVGATTTTNPTCFAVYYTDLESRVQMFNGANVLLKPAAAGVPGSLGPAALEGDLRIELTDIHEAMPPVAGMDLTGASASPRYFTITATATGQVRPATADRTQCDANSRAAAGVEASRAHVVVGPLVH